MDIKFHIKKIIESGSNGEDWINFIDQLKQKKCDRDLLTQIYTVALNNISDKKTKIYKKLLVGLANLQSETSPDLARTTFINANALDDDCAVVCVFYSQFEYKHQNKNVAMRLLKCGKCDGRTPTILIKKAYFNLKENKASLLDGIIDPWDESLYDVTDTATITQTSRNYPQSPPQLGLKVPHITRSMSKLTSKNLGMPTRPSVKTQSASSILKDLKVKSPTVECHEKFGLIVVDNPAEKNYKNGNDSGIFAVPASIERPPGRENKSCGPSLSPFMNVLSSPLVKNRNSSFFWDTPGGFMFEMIKSNEKDKPIVNRTIKKKFEKLFKDLDKSPENRNVTNDDGYLSASSFNNWDKEEVHEMIDNKSLLSSEYHGIKSVTKSRRMNRAIGMSKLQDDSKIKGATSSGLTGLIEDIDLGCAPLDTNKDAEIDIVDAPVKTPHVSSEKKQRKPLSLISQPLRNNDIYKSVVHKPKPIQPVAIKNTTLDFKENKLLSCSANKTVQPRRPLNEVQTIQNYSSKRPENVADTETKKSLFFSSMVTPGNDRKSVSHKTPLSEAKATKTDHNMIDMEEKPIHNFPCTEDAQTNNNNSLIPQNEQISESPTKEVQPINGMKEVLNDIQKSTLKLESQQYIQNILKNPKMDVNSLLQNGLQALGKNGFNMDPNLHHVPTNSTSKLFVVNGVTYKQIKCIGKGGSCKVYEVVDALGRVYALKRVKLQDLDSFMINSYLKEIKLLEEMKGQKHIIELYGWEKTAEYLLIVLEKGDKDLAHVLRTSQEPILDQLKHYWQQMLLAVSVVHAQGIVHADLKPANFLFVGKMLKLIDFGIADNIQANKTSVTREYQMGTLNYMSPEALMSDVSHESGASKISRASDVWSLGCMLYLMVFKKTPYQHINNQNAKIFAIQRGEAINFQGIKDRQLLDCLEGCLKYNKRERYTIQELLCHPFLS